MTSTLVPSTARSSAARWAPRWMDCQNSWVIPLGMTTIRRAAGLFEQPAARPASSRTSVLRFRAGRVEVPNIMGVRVRAGWRAVKSPHPRQPGAKSAAERRMMEGGGSRVFDGVLDLNLIHLFTFYLAAVFTVSTARRLRQYHDVAQLALAAPNRWPRVLQQLRGHWIMFLTWATLRPAAVAMGLLVIQMVCSPLICPTANLTLRDP